MSEDPALLQLAAWAGTAAGMLSTGAMLPQAWRILQRRSADDVSLMMFVAIAAASGLWIFYAWVYGSTALLVTNVAIGVLALVIVVLKLRFGRGGPAS